MQTTTVEFLDAAAAVLFACEVTGVSGRPYLYNHGPRKAAGSNLQSAKGSGAALSEVLAFEVRAYPEALGFTQPGTLKALLDAVLACKALRVSGQDGSSYTASIVQGVGIESWRPSADGKGVIARVRLIESDARGFWQDGEGADVIGVL